jgi:4-hydroxy-3-polyprenylbenzoate decarboxylase
VRRFIIAITGASGSIYGVRLLEVFRGLAGVETHLIVSEGAATTIAHELDRKLDDVVELAHVVHDDGDLAASIASGSYRIDGMVVAPCSIKTLSGIAHSYDSTLTIRAADVRLKERQPLVLLVRETPLHVGHLRAMTAAAEAGAIILPPVPSMYIRPASVDELVDHTVMRVCDQLGIDVPISPRWEGRGRPHAIT